MSSELPNAQVTINEEKGVDKEGRVGGLHGQRSVISRQRARTTHGFTSSGSDSCPGSSALTLSTCGVRPKSEYSNNDSSNRVPANSSVLPTLATMPQDAMDDPGADPSARRRGISCAEGGMSPSAVFGGLSMSQELARTT
jgi:hypothetical protein